MDFWPQVKQTRSAGWKSGFKGLGCSAVHSEADEVLMQAADWLQHRRRPAWP